MTFTSSVAETSTATDTGTVAASTFNAPVVETAADDREALLARAEALGVDVDKRWGVARLRAALDAAE
jgi:hypothetical protein